MGFYLIIAALVIPPVCTLVFIAGKWLPASFAIWSHLATGLLCAEFFALGVVWQIYIWKNCTEHNVARFKVFGLPAICGAIIAAVVLFGSIGYSLLAHIDGNVDNHVNLIGLAVSVCLICIAFVLKTFVGGSLLMSAVTWTVWNLMMHGEWTFIPIFKLMFKLVASGLPDWVSTAYVIVTLGFSLFTAISVSIDN